MTISSHFGSSSLMREKMKLRDTEFKFNAHMCREGYLYIITSKVVKV